jgi:hypothetical protein
MPFIYKAVENAKNGHVKVENSPEMWKSSSFSGNVTVNAGKS